MRVTLTLYAPEVANVANVYAATPASFDMPFIKTEIAANNHSIKCSIFTLVLRKITKSYTFPGGKYCHEINSAIVDKDGIPEKLTLA